jgi:transcriptional regulator with XRE-family HTH domain
MTEATLFHRCRKALGLSQSEIARALLIASDRTIRRWEQDELMVAGPAWVALEYLLRESAHLVLADKVAGVIRERRLEVYSWAPADLDIPDVGEEIP